MALQVSIIAAGRSGAGDASCSNTKELIREKLKRGVEHVDHLDILCSFLLYQLLVYS